MSDLQQLIEDAFEQRADFTPANAPAEVRAAVDAVIAELAPTSRSIVATGRGRALDLMIWWEVTTEDGRFGWVAAQYTARGDGATDWTSVVTGSVGGVPEASTMDALGEIVAEALAPTDQGAAPKISMAAAPVFGELGEVTFDIVGLNDIAEQALRVRVVGQPIDGGFSLVSADVTVMCVSTGDAPTSHPDGHQPWRLFCLADA